MKRLLLWPVLFSLFSSCGDHDVSKQIFKFTLGKVISDTEVWIVLHDHESGELIDSRMINVGTTEIFETKQSIPSGKLDVTLFQGSLDKSQILAEVYTDIEVGAEWVFANSDNWYDIPDPGSSQGTYELVITDVPSLQSMDVSDEFGGSFIASINLVGTTITVQPEIHLNSAGRQLVTIDTGVGKERYAWLENVQAGKSFSLSFSSFIEFDKYLTFTFPANDDVRFYSMGYDVHTAPNFTSFKLGHLNPGQLGTTAITQLNFGFLNDFPQYTIAIDLNPYRFESLGPAPTAIEYVDPNNFKTASPTIDTYSITASRAYDYRSATYRYSTQNKDVVIIYNASSGDVKHYEAIPQELATKFSINMNSVKYINTMIMVKGQSYEDFVQWNFADSNPLTIPYEHTIIYSSN